MIIIDKIKNPAPFFVYKPIPELFKTTRDEEAYWAEEKRKWIEGDGDLTGPLYWYASQVKLKDRITGEIFRPTVRDADILIFNTIKEAQKSALSPFMIKGRGVGLSSIGMSLPFYFFRINPGSNSIATSKDKKTLSTLFTDKSIVAFENFKNPYVKFDQIAKNQTSLESHLTVGLNYISRDGNKEYATSNFYCRDTQDKDSSATNFSGAGAIYGFADEAPLMPRLNLFLRSAIEVFTEHATNTIKGLLLMGGTCEDTLKTEDVQRIQYLWENASTKKILPLFISATYGKYMVNGHSNHKKAEEEILKKREELDKLQDKSDLKAYIKNNPLSIDEIFDLGKGGGFDDYTIEQINNQVKIVVRERPPIHTYTLVNEGVNEITAVPDKNSKIQILEQPKKGIRYTIGIDGIMTSDLTSPNEKTQKSEFSLCVMKGFDPSSDIQFGPVALYHERPKSIDVSHAKAINVLRYYNKFGNAKINGETNAGNEQLLKRIIDEGLKSTIGMRKDLSGKKYVDTSQMWYYRNDKIRDWQQEAANMYFKKYSHMVKFMDVLKDAQLSLLDNRDILDALMACLYEWGTGDPMQEVKTETKVYKMSMIVGYKDGTPIWEHREFLKTK